MNCLQVELDLSLLPTSQQLYFEIQNGGQIWLSFSVGEIRAKYETGKQKTTTYQLLFDVRLCC